MRIGEVTAKKLLTPIQQQHANLKRQANQLKVRKASLQLQASRGKLNKARQSQTR